jgi:hypothetical protein
MKIASLKAGVFLLIAVGCAPAVEPASSHPPASRNGEWIEGPSQPATLPNRLSGSGFVLRDVHHFSDPSLGVRIAYQNETSPLLVNVFIYPVGVASAELTSERRAELVRRSFEQSREDIREYERRGRYANLSFGEATEVSFQSRLGPAEGWATVAEFSSPSTALHSHLYVITLGRYYVKFRSTHPQELSELYGAVRRFVDEFLREFAFPEGREGTPAS